MRGSYRPILGRGTNGVGSSNCLASFDAASGEENSPALRPVITPSGGINARSASEFARGQHQCAVEQPSLTKIFKQRAIGVVKHRADQLAVTTDRAERSGAVNVPGNVVKDCLKHIQSYEADAPLDKPPREQATLAEAIHAISLANLFRFLAEFECFPRLRGGHQGVRLIEGRIHQLCVLVGLLEVLNGLVDFRAPASSPIHANGGDIFRRKHIRNLEIWIGRVGVQYKRVVSLAEKPCRIAMGKIAAELPDDIGQQHVRRHIAACSLFKPQHGAIVGRLKAALEEASRLHHLAAGVVHCRSGVINRAKQGEFVRVLRHPGKDLRDLYA